MYISSVFCIIKAIINISHILALCYIYLYIYNIVSYIDIPNKLAGSTNSLCYPPSTGYACLKKLANTFANPSTHFIRSGQALSVVFSGFQWFCRVLCGIDLYIKSDFTKELFITVNQAACIERTSEVSESRCLCLRRFESFPLQFFMG